MDDRILGCIVGGAIGDALGSLNEGAEAPGQVLNYQKWQLSDDTQLTLATCEAITNNHGVVDPSVIADHFASWHRQGRVTGMGASTYKALSELVHGGHWALVGRKGEHAAGNGAAMRIAPLAFCLNPADSESRRKIRDVSRITHHSEEAYSGALAVVEAIRTAQDGIWNSGNGLFQHIVELLPDSRVKDRLIELSQFNGTSISEIAKRFGCSGFVVESVPLALYGAQQLDSIGFAGVLSELVSAGGDTDTTASIAGQVMGTALGRLKIPEKMVKRVPNLDQIERIALKFGRSFVERSAI
jgi:ADP-ribosyl-[dinitrogen reductase] hydrolase